MEEDIKIIKNHYVFTTNHVLDDKNKQFKQAIENLINKTKEQEKMIELMADEIFNLDTWNVLGYHFKQRKYESKEHIIDYFRKKAKGE